MLVDFGGFKRIVDAVGGVEICLAAPVDDPLSGLKLEQGHAPRPGRGGARLRPGPPWHRRRLRHLSHPPPAGLHLLAHPQGALERHAAEPGRAARSARRSHQSADGRPAARRHQQPQGPGPEHEGPQAVQRHVHDTAVDPQRRQRHRQREHREGQAHLGGHGERHILAAEGRCRRRSSRCSRRPRDDPRERAQRHRRQGQGQGGGQGAAQAGLPRGGGRQRGDVRLRHHDRPVRPGLGHVRQDPHLRLGRPGQRAGQEAGPDDEPHRRHRLDRRQEVQINDITQDYTANVNTGDEAYCAS